MSEQCQATRKMVARGCKTVGRHFAVDVGVVLCGCVDVIRDVLGERGGGRQGGWPDPPSSYGPPS